MNPYEQLCKLASRENWCWKLNCTTCGHVHFRYSFAELAAGKIPADKEWLIHRRRTNYMEELGRWPGEYSDEQKVSVLEICAKADISLIADRCKFPNWLGYLGLVLEHMNCDHTAYQTVSTQWAKQLRDLSPAHSQIYYHLDNIVTSEHATLTIKDLQQFESSSRPDIRGHEEQYNLDLDSPEARANFATRHIRNLSERRRRRSELIQEYQANKIVDMFPGQQNHGSEDT